MGVSVGEFAVVGMASFDLVWFEWLRGVQARDCGDSGVVFKQEIVEIVVYCTRLWLAWCLVLGFGSLPFHQCPQRRSLCAGWLAQSAARQRSVVCFLDVAMLVGAVFFAGGVLSFVRSFFPLLLLPCGSIMFGQKCAFEVQVQVLLVSCDGRFRRRVYSCGYGEF